MYGFQYCAFTYTAYFSKSVKRLTEKVCVLSSLCPFVAFTASAACSGRLYSKNTYLKESGRRVSTG